MDRVASLCSQPGHRASFLDDLFASERSCLAGDAVFVAVLSDVLDRWGSSVDLNEALALWQELDIHQPCIDMLQRYRRDKRTLCLASNQQDYRADYMRNRLAFDQYFDETFFSCELGSRKPSSTFFRRILAKLNAMPNEALLIDDSQENVEAARAFGLKAEVYSCENDISELRQLLDKHLQNDARQSNTHDA